LFDVSLDFVPVGQGRSLDDNCNPEDSDLYDKKIYENCNPEVNDSNCNPEVDAW